MPSLVGRAGAQLGAGSEEERARKSQRVVGYPEERDCVPNVFERLGRAALDDVESPDRPVETDTCVRIDLVVGTRESFADDAGRLLVVACVGERVAEESRVTNLDHDIV